MTSPDGLSYPAGLYDTMLGTECVAGAAEDGSLRCIPNAAVNEPPMRPPIVEVNYYPDSACATPAPSIAAVDATPRSCPMWPAPTFATMPTACGTQVFAVVGIDPGPIYQSCGTGCCGSVTPSFSTVYYDLRLVTPSELAPLTRVP